MYLPCAGIRMAQVIISRAELSIWAVVLSVGHLALEEMVEIG
jgi:DMSO/TMAO reductase YedYZ heme-binding membrane subunit